jgi:hypothetical protein
LRRLAIGFASAAVVAVAVLPAGAGAAGGGSYRLAKPGATCRTGYTRQIRRVKERLHGKTVTVRQVWCVANAGAAHPSYQLKKTTERCRAGYVREVRSVKKRTHGKLVRVRQVWCVYKSATTPTSTGGGGEQTGSSKHPSLLATSTYVSITSSAAAGEGSYLNVASGLFDNKHAPLNGLPIEYTVTDSTSGQPIGSFSGVSGIYSFCTVLYQSANGTQSFSGQVPTPLTGCAIGPVSLPATDVVTVRASFAGNTTYAQSASEPRSL